MDCANHELLSQTARSHAQNPRNQGPLAAFNGHARITGPCGDTMEFWLAVQDERLVQVSFVTDGCGSSLACGSMATCLVEGKQVPDAAGLRQQDILEALGGLPQDSEHCALLAANTLKAACQDYLIHRRELPGEKCSEGKKTCGSCDNPECSAAKPQEGESQAEFEDRRKLESRLCRIKHKIVVLSGKGGVGKSTVAVNLAVALMLSGKRVGLLDVDIHGPSIPTMLGLEGETILESEDGLLPIELGDIKVMSLGFLIRNQDDAIIWRGPMKMGVIKQFLQDVTWGELDYLIIDSPPGTGDEPLSVCQLISSLDGAVIVTTPQKVAAIDVRKSVTFCRQLKVPVLGVVENMSGFVCPGCGIITNIFCSGAGQEIAQDMGVPFLGSIPIDPQIAEACDNGRSYIHHYAASQSAQRMQEIIKLIINLDGNPGDKCNSETNKEKIKMKIAIPLADGLLAMHFGHCQSFALVDVDPAKNEIIKREDIEAPPHQPGLLPPWLAERGAQLIIAGGMGQRAQALFSEQGIKVIVGAPAESPERLVVDYLAGNLKSGENVCDH